MAFKLTGAQVTELSGLIGGLVDPATSTSYDPNNRSGYGQLYEKILEYIADYKISNTLSLEESRTELWIEGALGVNQDNSAQSDFIRDYNNIQSQLRYGTAVTDAQMNKISDEIAYKVATEMLRLNSISDPVDLPIISTIAEVDAGPAASSIFNNDLTPGGWAGNPLFLFLGHSDAFNSNILQGDGDTYDALAMFKALNEAGGGYVSYFAPGLTTAYLFWDAYTTNMESYASGPFLDAVLDLNDYFKSAYGVGIGNIIREEFSGDLILGTEGNDTALKGSDTSFAGFSYDEIIHAGDGDDTVIATYGNDIMDGGRGIDTLSYAEIEEDVTVDLFNHAATIDHTFSDDLQRVYNFENVIGGSGNDTLIGNAQDNRLEGGEGNDRIVSNGGNDKLIGGAGNDTFVINSLDSGIVTIKDDTGTLIIDGVIVGNIYGDSNEGSLVSGFAQQNETTDIWTLGGYTLTLSGNNLLMDKGIQRVVLENFQDGDYGIRLDAQQLTEYYITQTAMTHQYGFVADEYCEFINFDTQEIFGCFASEAGQLAGGNWGPYRIGVARDLGTNVYGVTTGTIVKATNLSGTNGNDAMSTAGLAFSGSITISTGAGHDVIRSNYDMYQTQNVYAGADRDIIYTHGGLGSVYGEEGDDYIEMFGGDGSLTQVYGGEGRDYFVGVGASLVDGGTGIDTWDLRNVSVSDIDANLGTLTLSNMNGHAVAFSNIENFLVKGSTDADLLVLASGDDSVNGDAGNDSIEGGAGKDTLYGGSGLDTIWGGEGADFIDGGDDNDSLIGGAGSDTIIGGAGQDALYGGDDADFLYGGAGDDYIEAGMGDDFIIGGAGSDYIDGGDGIDTVSYENSSAWVNVDLANNNHWNGDASWDNIINVENIIGSAYNDALTGTSGVNILTGGNGNDTLSGLAGNDTIYGGAGDDYITGGDNNDLIIGGAGSDYINGGNGIDTVSYADSSDWVSVNLQTNNHWNGDASWDNIVNVENVIGSNHNDSLTGTNIANSLIGGMGNDTLYGLAGNDTLWGGDGNDYIYGGDGGDRIQGGYGNNYLDSGSGAGSDELSYAFANAGINLNLVTNTTIGTNINDTLVGSFEFIVDTVHTDTILGGSAAENFSLNGGNDTVDAGGGNDGVTINAYANYVLEGGSGIDILGFNTSLSAYSYNMLTGILSYSGGTMQVSGFERILGTNGNDTMIGASANDTFSGGMGNDYLDGGDGNDDLFGATGDDTLTGGNGNDVFSFANAYQGHDVITDFQGVGAAAGDLIRITGSNFAALTFTQNGADAVITPAAGGSITLIGVNSALLTSDDFLFT